MRFFKNKAQKEKVEASKKKTKLKDERRARRLANYPSVRIGEIYMTQDKYIRDYNPGEKSKSTSRKLVRKSNKMRAVTPINVRGTNVDVARLTTKPKNPNDYKKPDTIKVTPENTSLSNPQKTYAKIERKKHISSTGKRIKRKHFDGTINNYKNATAKTPFVNKTGKISKKDINEIRQKTKKRG